MTKRLIAFAFGLGMTMLMPLSSSATSVNTCPNDYYGFIKDVRSEHTRNEYFKDFFERNWCQVEDILTLNDELDQLQDTFREAAFVCGDTAEYKEQYLRILLETYFVRHLQETSEGVLNDFEIEEIEQRKELTLKELREEMIELFVSEEQQIPVAQLNEYFDEWSRKYEDKVVDYAQCDSGPWFELNESIESFNETISEISIAVDKKKRNEKLVQFEGDSESDTRDWSRISKSVTAFFNKSKDQAEDEVEPVPTINEAAQQARGIDATFELLEDEQRRFDVEKASAERTARYQILYGEGGARPSRDLQLLVAGINEVIIDTNTTDFPQIQKGIEKIYAKQCR